MTCCSYPSMPPVLFNLCKNASEAVNGIRNSKIKLKADTDGRGNPVIKVSDNGKGITEEVAEKVFIPFHLALG
jgi:two-component system nitrogen regulation sensor histidine kinase NtrY